MTRHSCICKKVFPTQEGSRKHAARKKDGAPYPPRCAGCSISLGLKVTAEIKNKLDEAARLNGRTQSQEAEFRLEQSFGHQGLLAEIMMLTYGPKWGEWFAELAQQNRVKFKKGGTARFRKRMNEYFDSLEEGDK